MTTKQIKIGRNDPCWCKSGRKYKQCHEQIDKKIYHFALEGKTVPSRDMLKTPEQVEKIKESAVINIACLDTIEKEIKEIQSLLSSEEVQSDYEKLLELSSSVEKDQSALEELYIEWEELQEKLC